MGYITRYKLSMEKDSETESRIIESVLGVPVRDTFDAKWYGWKEDLLAMSRRFPHIRFTLDGVGENPDDMWRAFIHNGLVEIHERPIWKPPAKPRGLSW